MDKSKFTYDDYSFEKFQELADHPTASTFEKIGFPDEYRRGHEENILADIERKLTNINKPFCSFLEIGPGLSSLPVRLAEKVIDLSGSVYWVDGTSVLDKLPELEGAKKIQGQFPFVHFDEGSFDAILAYSVLHYVRGSVTLEDFLDFALSLLKPGGQILFGDIPNESSRKRFFNSQTGRDFHMKFMRTDSPPQLELYEINAGKYNDATLLNLVLRCRLAGFDAYILPQAPELPFANRREDLLVKKH